MKILCTRAYNLWLVAFIACIEQQQNVVMFKNFNTLHKTCQETNIGQEIFQLNVVKSF